MIHQYKSWINKIHPGVVVLDPNRFESVDVAICAHPHSKVAFPSYAHFQWYYIDNVSIEWLCWTPVDHDLHQFAILLAQLQKDCERAATGLVEGRQIDGAGRWGRYALLLGKKCAYLQPTIFTNLILIYTFALLLRSSGGWWWTDEEPKGNRDEEKGKRKEDTGYWIFGTCEMR